MTVEFNNPGATVTTGSARRTVSLNGLPVVDETVALCDEATTCPLATGFNNRSAASTWPDVTGKVVSTVHWYDESKAELLCIKTTVTAGAAAGPRLRGVPPATAERLQHLAQPVFRHSTALVALSPSEFQPLEFGGLCPAVANHTHGGWRWWYGADRW